MKRAIGDFFQSKFYIELAVAVALFAMAAFLGLIVEFIVNVVKINKENLNSFDTLFSSPVNFHILIFSGVLIFLFTLRFLANKISPDRFKHDAHEQ